MLANLNYLTVNIIALHNPSRRKHDWVETWVCCNFTYHNLSINVYQSFQTVWLSNDMLTQARTSESTLMCSYKKHSLRHQADKGSSLSPVSCLSVNMNLTLTHSQSAAQFIICPPLLCRHLSGAVWPTARRTGSTFTNCARTPTSSPTWDVQTPPAPCSPPPRLSLPTDWLAHITDRTLWPISRQDCRNWRKMDVDGFCFFYLSCSQMDKLATEQN